MEIETSRPDKLTLRLSGSDIRHWNNALNEVCNGFAVANLEAALGISQQHVDDLLRRVHHAEPQQPLELVPEELLALRNALTMTLAELDAREFQTRMGVSVEDAREMRNALDAIAGQMRLFRTA